MLPLPSSLLRGLSSVALATATALAATAFGACAADAPPDPDASVDVKGPLCGPDNCFPKDGCSDAFCQPDGTCLQVAHNAFEACLTDAHCDDGDGCTVDSCGTDECGLQRCRHDRRGDCQSCQPFACPEGMPNCNDTQCDDGQACTADTCGPDGICHASAPDPSCDPGCQLGWQPNNPAQSVYNASYGGGYQGYTSYWIGSAGAASGACDGADCGCRNELALKDDGFAFPLRDTLGLGADEWGCDVTACELRSVSCEPLIEGVGYVVWGEMKYLAPFDAATPGASFDAAAPPPQTIDGLDVQGYCLSTRLDHLPGTYAATLDVGAKRATFDLVLASTLDHWVEVDLGACTGCADVGLVAGQTAPVDDEPGVLGFALAFGDGAAPVRLYGHQDRFIGEVALSGGAHGHLELERVAP